MLLAMMSRASLVSPHASCDDVTCKLVSPHASCVNVKAVTRGSSHGPVGLQPHVSDESSAQVSLNRRTHQKIHQPTGTKNTAHPPKHDAELGAANNLEPSLVVLSLVLGGALSTTFRDPCGRACYPAELPFYQEAAVLPLCSSAFMTLPASRELTSKKGVGAWYFEGVQKALASSGVSWFYVWGSSPACQTISPPSGIEFVPMIWGRDSIQEGTLQAASNYKALLGFNEPDRLDQADMQVKEAIDLWPHMMAANVRLGSPAPANADGSDSDWLGSFMKEAVEKGLRVDFICLHWYGSHPQWDIQSMLASLQGYLERIHDKYQQPIWLTEFSLIFWDPVNDWRPAFPSEEVQAAFATAAGSLLNSLDYVERYAWFALPAFGSDSTTSLYSTQGKPTPVGMAYEAVP